MPLIKLPVLTLLLAIHCEGKRIPAFAGPFLGELVKSNNCPGFPSFVSLRASHFNPMNPFKNQRLYGNATLPMRCDDNFWGDIKMAHRSNNQWKENALCLKFPKRLCSNARDEFPLLFQLFNGTTTSGSCVIKAGVHFFNGNELNFDFPSVPALPYGHYKSVFSMGKTGEKAPSICGEFELKIHPRPA